MYFVLEKRQHISKHSTTHFTHNYIYQLLYPYSFIHPFVRSFVRSSIHSFIYSFIQPFIHSFMFTRVPGTCNKHSYSVPALQHGFLSSIRNPQYRQRTYERFNDPSMNIRVTILTRILTYKNANSGLYDIILISLQNRRKLRQDEIEQEYNIVPLRTIR